MSTAYEKLKQIEQSGEAMHALYCRVFNTPDGEIVLEDLKQRGFWYWTTQGVDANQTLVNEGRRQLLLTIVSRLDAVSAAKQEE